MRFLNLTLLLAVAAFLKVTSANSQWTVTSPFGGAIVEASIAIGNKVLVGTNSRGIYVSGDNGTTWTTSNTGLTNNNVSSFAIVGGNLFAATMGNGVFISTDNGASWTNPSNTGLTNPFIQSLISVGNNLFAATEECIGCNGGGVFMSKDNGSSWAAVNNGIPGNSANSLASIGNNLFASSPGVGIYRSSDSGSSWVSVDSGYYNSVISLVTDGTNLYAATTQGLYRSSDNGNSWSDLNDGLINSYNNLPYAIGSFALHGNYLFAGSTTNIYMSGDNGASWGEVNSSAWGIQSIFFINGFVFASGSNGFYSQSLLSFPTITSVAPSSGIIGTTVTIKGSAFSTTPSNNIINMGNVFVTAITSASDSISFIVPPEAQTTQSGKNISVTVNGETSTLPYHFQVAPNIISFTPTSGPPGTSVTVSGTGFGNTRSGVTLNGHPTMVYPGTTTSLVMVVPDSVTSGPITVSVGGLTSTSAVEFVVTASAALPSAGGYGSVTWRQPIRAGATCQTIAMDSKYNLYFAGEANAVGSQPSYFGYTLFPENTNNSYLIKTDTSYNIKWRKVIQVNNHGTVQTSKVQVDNNGNIILTGTFSGPVTIDSVTLTVSASPFVFGVFIVKFNSDGKLLWANSAVANGTLIPNSLKIDDSNNIYIAGSGNGLCRFYNNGIAADSINGPSGYYGYYAKYDANGTFLWVKSFVSGSDNFLIRAMAIDKSKNIYLTGSWQGSGSFASVPKEYSSSIIIIAKFDSTRNLVWLKQIGSLNNISSYGRDIVVNDQLQCFYVTGYFISGDFGGGVLDANGANVFFARYTLEGKFQWVRQLASGANSGVGTNLTLDKDGLVYLGGVIGPCENGQCPTFGETALSTYHNPSNPFSYGDAFLGKYDADGVMMWVEHIGDPNTDDTITGMAKDDKGNLYFSGQTGRRGIFGPYQMPYDYSVSLGFAAKINDGKVSYFQVSNNSFTIKADSNLTRSFQVITNQKWSASSSVDWLSTNVTQGNGSSEIIITAQVNSSLQRSGAIMVLSNMGSVLEVLVMQSGLPPTVTAIAPSKDKLNLVYPNPARDVLQLLTENSGMDTEASIIDVTGREVMNLVVTTGEIDVRSLEPGVYILKLITSEGATIGRFVKIEK